MNIEGVAARFVSMSPFLDERMRRLFAASEAAAIGFGGVTAVAKATGVSRRAIAVGLTELKVSKDETSDSSDSEPSPLIGKRVRKEGGGRKRTVDTDPSLRLDLEKLIDPVTRGDPESPLRWTCKSLRHLSGELNLKGHRTSHRMVAELLAEMGYSLQANRKTHEGESQHPDRNAQFEYVAEQVKTAQAEKQPVISVDTKKKELIGNFKNAGRELCPKGEPEQVRVHDFVIAENGKASPYGVYDITQNVGWVSVGTDHDTAAFAVSTIRDWWYSMGKVLYNGDSAASRLLITADGGGSNGSRVRLWKQQLQCLSNETGLSITVCHLPPGTSKWNKIEHRLFSYITQNWRGKPLTSHEAIVSLIAATTTKQGLKVHAELDTRCYPCGIKIGDEEMAQINLRRHEFHGEWNYTISPNQI